VPGGVAERRPIVATTAAETFPTKVDAKRFERTANELYNALEQLALRVPSIREYDPADEDRPVTDENIVALSRILDTLDIEMDQIEDMRARLRGGLRYLVTAQEEHDA
jgi:hypothetical protein